MQAFVHATYNVLTSVAKFVNEEACRNHYNSIPANEQVKTQHALTTADTARQSYYFCILRRPTPLLFHVMSAFDEANKSHGHVFYHPRVEGFYKWTAEARIPAGLLS